MKIVDLKTIVVGNPWKNWAFLKLETDEGISGLGECTGGLTTKPAVAMVQELRRRIVGRDPENVNELIDFLRKTLFLFRGGEAVSAVEMACWDCIAKAKGVPVYKLLGGKAKPSIRAYANGWYDGERTPEGFAEKARQMVDMGYTALKFDPFGTAYRFMSREEERFALRIVEKIREAVGENVDLLIEAHDRFSLSQAVRIGQMLEPLHPYWYETPVLSDNIPLLNETARRVRIPVIAGERFSDPREIAQLLSGGCVDLINPEVVHIGGVQGLLDCFAIARGWDASVAPHNAQSPFCTAVNVNVGITQPNMLIQECFDDAAIEWMDDVISGQPRVVNGYIEPREAPGFGVEINEEEAEKHPYGDGNFLWLFEESWEKRKGRN